MESPTTVWTPVEENIKALWEDDNLVIGEYLSNTSMRGRKIPPGRPMLRRFMYHQKDIRCIQSIGGGADGVVVRAEIGGRLYALKFKKFKFSGPAPPRTKEHAIYRTPLANESRAFARLDSMDLNGKWAVKCHGWIKLSHRQFRSISQVADLSCCTPWVIVKDYISTPTNPDHIDKIVETFGFPHEASILPADIRPENYKDQFLLDLGNTITFPHPQWSWWRYDFFYEHTTECPKQWEYRNGEFI